MGRLVRGEWVVDAQIGSSDGSFDREDTSFRNWISKAGGSAEFPAAGDRYHLYVAWACPWAHRALIMRTLKGLESVISVSVVEPRMGERGWVFAEPASSDCIEHSLESLGDGTGDQVNGKRALYEVYQLADPDYTGKVTVPVLWDKKTSQIVNNESADIVRIFNNRFDEQGATPGDYYPESRRDEIDELNSRIYNTVNNGVYRAGFAGSQSVYESAVDELFDTLDWLETRLATQRFLVGDQTTEADWRLLPTLLRFDAVYAVHFKCSRRRLVDYPNLWAYTRDLYQHPGIAETFRLQPTLTHYYCSHPALNPKELIAVPPALEFSARHSRAKLQDAEY